MATRRVALALLQGTLHRRRPLDEQMADNADFRALADRDRAFVHNLVATALRRGGQVDDLLARCIAKPLPARARPVMDVLRLGATQLLFTDVPDHAAVDTAVRLVVAVKQGRFEKLVNGVLRRLGREGAAMLADQEESPGAARLNTPDWLWRSWEAAYGADACRRIAESHLAPAPLDITVKDDAAGWARRLGAARLPTGTLRLADGGAVTALPGYDDGAWWVQDAAAALPARLLGDVRGRAVLDLCAAPGGKAAQLAAAGARVTALDRSEKRLAVLRRNMNRLGLEVETVVADAAEWTPDAAFDAVLLDAPCTATGTIRRHPDLPHVKRADDVAGLAALQARLLARAATMVRPGGVLVFCTCSLQPEEGPARVDAFLAATPGFRRHAVTPDLVGGLDDLIDGNGDLRTLPCRLAEAGGMDGFFAARLTRTT